MNETVKEWLQNQINYLNREIINSKEDFDNAGDWYDYTRKYRYRLEVLEDELRRVENDS